MVVRLLICALALFGSIEAISQTLCIYDDAGRIASKYTPQIDEIPPVRSFYRYDGRGRIKQLITDNGLAENVDDLKGVTERFITTFQHHPYFHDQDHPTEILLKYIDVTTGKEQLILHTFNTYDSEKRLIQREIIDSEGTYTHMTFDDTGKPLTILKCPKQGEQQRMTFEYDSTGRLVSVSKETRAGITELLYDNNGFPIIRRNTDDPYADEPWAKDVAESIEFYSDLFSSLQKAVERMASSLFGPSTFREIEENLENYAKALMGHDTFAMSGFYTYPERVGVYGNGEVDEKVRITLINGILNDPNNHMENLDLFCNTHGGVNIHYVFRPYAGYSKDILRSAGAKMGHVSPQARDLARTWKELIAEMGGVDGGGLIIHYAHSLGGTDTLRAKELMHPEELKMIQVYTFASPSMIHPGIGFQKVKNYLSYRDGVPQVFDAGNYFWGLVDGDDRVEYVGTIRGWWFVDHLITNPAYRTILEKKGLEFQETYIKKKL